MRQEVHLHEFLIGGVRYGVPDPEFPNESVASESRIKLDSVLKPSVSHFLYTYDFGDGTGRKHQK